MFHTPRALNGIVSSPHHLASQSGADVLRDGGSAVEAAIAMAATLAVVYPHMTGLGGDALLLIAEPGSDPVSISSCGRAARTFDPARYAGAAMPVRGPDAALTVAGAVAAWDAALAHDRAQSSHYPLPLSRLFRDAILLARDGVALPPSLLALLADRLPDLRAVPGFADTFLVDGRLPDPHHPFRQAALARTLQRLALDRLDGFYRGALAEDFAADLAEAGSPLRFDDLASHRVDLAPPLRATLRGATVFNTRPPTQGAAALLILSLFDRLAVPEADGVAHVHALVEATKPAFRFRDTHLQDPAAMRLDVQSLLDDPAALDRLAGAIDPHRAAPWPDATPDRGDTVWFGAIDRRGQAVSMIQSLFFEFGSGVVLPRTGVLWQNRGAAFVTTGGVNRLRPGAQPFHTLNPALARFADGRVLAYGSMGGDGQPQFGAALFTRHARFNQELQRAVSAPRWLLGRTWGTPSPTLKLERGLPSAVFRRLRDAGHAVEWLPAFSSGFGHAGAVSRHPSGLLEGAADPRSDGAVAAL